MFGQPKTEEDRLKIAKKMFIIGFFLLPGVWLVLLCYFSPYWKKRTTTAKKIQFYMKISIIGSVIEIGAILAWFITYQAKWKSWGAAGDNLNVIAYRGE